MRHAGLQTVSSAGLKTHNGRSVPTRVQEWARERMSRQAAEALKAHKSALVTEEAVLKADIVLVMDSGNWKRFHTNFPDYAPKLRMLADWYPRGKLKRLQDPAFLSTDDPRFDASLEEVRDSARAFVKALLAGRVEV